MNIGQVLLLNVLLVGAGIFTYDVIKGDSAPADTPDYEASIGATAPEAGPTDDYTPEPALQGGAETANRGRIEKLENELASMKELLAKLSVKGANTAAVGSDGPVASIDLPVVDEGDENPEFTDDSLRSLRAMMEKVEQQRRDERIVEGMKRQLDRLGLELSDDQEQAVIKATMDYRNKQRQMWRDLPRGNDDETREKRREAFESTREEWSKTVYSLVPSGDAEKIVSGMSGRSTGGFDMRRRGGGGDGAARRGR